MEVEELIKKVDKIKEIHKEIEPNELLKMLEIQALNRLAAQLNRIASK